MKFATVARNVLFAGASAPALLAQCGLQWQSGPGLVGVQGTVAAMAEWDPDGAGPQPPMLVLGGSFVGAGTAAATNIATFDPASGTWAALGSGVNGPVQALAIAGNGDLLASGNLDGLAQPARVAAWNGSVWTPIGGSFGIGSRIQALAVSATGTIAVGGRFIIAGGNAALNVAQWSGTSWLPIGGGVSVSSSVFFTGVRALAWSGTDLVVGGDGLLGSPVNGIVRWNGATWAPLGGGTNSGVHALRALQNGDLAAGGPFSVVGGVPATGLARWDGTGWSAYPFSLGGPVVSLCQEPGGDLVAGSASTGAVRWNGVTATTVATDGPVLALQAAAGAVFLAGSLASVGGTAVQSVARWQAGAVTALSPGFIGYVSAFARLPGGGLVAGGPILSTGIPGTRGIAGWNGSWSSLGGGMNGSVFSLRTTASGDLLAGGVFTVAGGVAAGRIARWNGAAWSSIGDGLDDVVHAVVEMPNGDVIVGGNFAFSNTPFFNYVPRLARWNGSGWSSVGGGPSGIVRCLAVSANGDLLVGGQFGSAGGTTVNFLGRWNGSAWSSFGGGMNDYVLALLPLPGGDLIAGGWFTTAGGQPAARIARWNGSSWSPLGSGMNGRVEALELLPNGDVLAGGAFTTAGGVAVNHLARWDGSNWSAVGAGFAGVQQACVYGIAAQPHGELAAGGNFLTADGVTSAGFARALPTCPAIAVPFGTGCAGTGGPDVLVAATLPWVGSTFRAVGSGLPPLAFVSIVYGFAPLQPALPLSAVLPAALPGCDLRVSPDVLDFAVAVGGSLTTSVVLPNTTSLAGVLLLQQLDSFEFDAGFQLVEVTASNALQLTLGVF